MVDTSLGSMIVTIILIFIALYILLKFFREGNGEEEEKTPNAPEVLPESRLRQAQVNDERFLRLFTQPMFEEGINELETAVDSIRLGCELYGRGAWIEASEEFHEAGKNLDEASERFREVLAMLEDQDSAEAKKAKDGLSECKRFHMVSSDAENACDAMIEEREEDAKKIVPDIGEIEKMAREWHR